MINEQFVLVGAALNLIGSLSYLRDTIRGKTKPNRVSWFLWALAPLIAFGAQIDDGVGFSALMTFMVGFGPLLIFLGSFVNRRSEWRLNQLDLVCGILSILGLALWLTTGDGILAIIFAIVADGLAAVPTLVKAYKEPKSENWHAFLLGAISAGITLLTIDNWDFAHVGFPAYIFAVCIALFILIKFEIGNKKIRS